MSNTVATLQNLINEIQTNLPKEINEKEFGGRSSEVSKILNIRAGLLYRAYDLSNSALKIIDDNLISGKLLARGLFETSAVLAYLNLKIKKFIETKDLNEFNDKLTQILVGSKIGESPASLNIITAVQSVEKQTDRLEGFENYFATLCEFAHPNFFGVVGSFGKIEDAMTKYSLVPCNFEKQKQDTINALCFGIKVLIYFSLEIQDKMDKFIEVYNDVLSEQ